MLVGCRSSSPAASFTPRPGDDRSGAGNILNLSPLSRTNGDSRTCCWLDPVAKDPLRKFVPATGSDASKYRANRERTFVAARFEIGEFIAHGQVTGGVGRAQEARHAHISGRKAANLVSHICRVPTNRYSRRDSCRLICCKPVHTQHIRQFSERRVRRPTMPLPRQWLGQMRAAQHVSRRFLPASEEGSVWPGS